MYTYIYIYMYTYCDWVAIGSKSITGPIPVGQNAFPQTKRPRSLKEVQAENTKQQRVSTPKYVERLALADMAQAMSLPPQRL